MDNNQHIQFTSQYRYQWYWKGQVMVKKKIDEYQVYEKHYEQIHEQVKNDPYAQSLGIQLTKFEAGFAEATLEV
ncbi:hypothetical protein [Peribacillus simplex]|uniref:hypothetical protein n=1 Tax=Peribacillus simplex TaxID=1478 RepID=UPI003D2D005D